MFGELYTTHRANNTEMGQNTTSQIPVKSEHENSAELIFNVIGLNLPRYGLGHKLRQITNCDGRDSWFVAICDCCNLWRFKTQLLTLMSIVPDGLHLSTENTFTYTSDNFKKVTCYIVYGLYSQWNNTKWSKMQNFHIHGKSEPGHSLKYPEHIFSVIGINMPRHSLDHKLRQITNCDDRIPALSKFVTVAICDDSKYSFPDWCQMYPRVYSLVQKTSSHQHRILSRRFPGYINYGLCDWYTYTNRYISEITPKCAKIQLFILMSEVNLGTLPSTQNTFSMLLDMPYLCSE